MSRRTTEEQAKKAYERAIKTEQEFGEYFTGIFNYLCHNIIYISFLLYYYIYVCVYLGVVQGDTKDEIYSKVKSMIWSQSGSVIWVPSRESL